MALGNISAADSKDPAIVADYQVDRYHSVKAVGPEYMDVRRLESLRDVHRIPATDFSVISAFANSQDLALMAGKGRTEVTYSDWKAEYPGRERRARFRMMRLTTMGTNAVLQVAESGRVSSVVLTGNDPTRFSAGGRKCEILEIYSYRLPRSLRRDGTNPPILDVYLRIDSLPDGPHARSIVRELQKRFGHADVRASMRNDTRFIEDSRFPSWFPFSEDTPPGIKEYNWRDQVFCSADASQILRRR